MTDSKEESTILIVDDSHTSLSLLFKHLRASGFRVLVAESGADALDQVDHTIPDLILLDVVMPGMDGFEVCQRLKEKEATRDIPIIFMTALSDARSKVRGLKVGAVDYITKPTYAEELLARIETHLTLQGLQRQLQEANRELESRVQELARSNTELREALSTIKTLSGVIPICAWCGRKIRDEEGRWIQLEAYIAERSEAKFSHGMCPDCAQKL